MRIIRLWYFVLILLVLSGCSADEAWSLSEMYTVQEGKVSFRCPDLEWGVSSSEADLQSSEIEQNEKETDYYVERILTYQGQKVKARIGYGFLEDRLFMISYLLKAENQVQFEQICSLLQQECDSIPEVETQQTGSYIQNGALWMKTGDDGSLLSIDSNANHYVIHILASAITP